MILDKHWWKTRDGRLVPDGDPAAATLAYPKGHEVPDHLAEQIGLKAAVDAEQNQQAERDREAEDEQAGREAEQPDGPADEKPVSDPEPEDKQGEQPAGDKMTRKPAADKTSRLRRTA